MRRFLGTVGFCRRCFFYERVRRIWIFPLLCGSLLLLSACSGNSDGGSPSKPLFSLSGTIRMPGHTSVDSDVNDARAGAPAPLSNNTFDSAQLLSAPVILGGFVTVAQSPFCAEGGRLCADGDPSDFFRIALSGDQTIRLSVMDALDASIYLYDADQILLDSVSGSFKTLNLSITDASGDYYVEVRTRSGASNYTMAIASTASLTRNQVLKAENDFVPGEFIVRFKHNQKDRQPVETAVLKSQSLGLTVVSQPQSGPLLVRIRNDQKDILFKNLRMHSVIHNFSGGNGGNARRNAELETLQIIQAMRQRSDVLYAEPNYIRKPLATTPNDEHYGLQWHYPMINLPDAWELIPDGTGTVVVAVVDTGVLMGHPDLAGQLTTDGYDFISDSSMANDGDGIDDDPHDSGDLLYDGESSFHGTHVSGTIAAATDNSIGVAGVTWRTGTLIMPLRAIGVGGGTSYDVMQAVKYAAGLPNDSGLFPVQRADVINLSIGGPALSEFEKEIFNQVRAAGVIAVAAAGNEATNEPVYPASYTSVISVSAVSSNAELAPYSNYGATIDVAAPGGDFTRNLTNDGYPDGILSTLGDDEGGYKYVFYEGTSMATPHVAGVAALMKAVEPDLTPDAFDAFLIAGRLTSEAGPIGRDDEFGYGLIDAERAVLAAQDYEIPTVLKVDPAFFDFGSRLTTTTLTARIMGGGSLSITSVETDAAWITVSPAEGDLDSDPGTTDIPATVEFDVHADRPGDFLDGSYTATITFRTTENTFEVPVTIHIDSTDQTSDAGFHYVALIDSGTFETVHQIGAVAQNGRYDFQFDSVAEGQYLLLSYGDMDNDGEIEDPGEAFGMFLTTEHPFLIDVRNHLTGLDFSSGFNYQ